MIRFECAIKYIHVMLFIMISHLMLAFLLTLDLSKSVHCINTLVVYSDLCRLTRFELLTDVATQCLTNCFVFNWVICIKLLIIILFELDDSES